MINQILNRKHEMFLNSFIAFCRVSISKLNRKHEMFLNSDTYIYVTTEENLTVNMKCF